jgi:hypothetical protein
MTTPHVTNMPTQYRIWRIPDNDRQSITYEQFKTEFRSVETLTIWPRARRAQIVLSVLPLSGRQFAPPAVKIEESMEAELDSIAALIPDWAAVTTALGSIAAIVGFVAAWLLPGPGPLLVLTCGLIACAIGMRSAERAIEKLTP